MIELGGSMWLRSNGSNHRTQITFATHRSLDFVPVHWDVSLYLFG